MRLSGTRDRIKFNRLERFLLAKPQNCIKYLKHDVLPWRCYVLYRRSRVPSIGAQQLEGAGRLLHIPKYPLRIK